MYHLTAPLLKIGAASFGASFAFFGIVFRVVVAAPLPTPQVLGNTEAVASPWPGPTPETFESILLNSEASPSADPSPEETPLSDLGDSSVLAVTDSLLEDTDTETEDLDPTPSPSASPTPVASPTASPSPTPTPSPKATPTPSPLPTLLPTPTPTAAADLEALFTKYADEKSVNRELLKKIAVCESNLNPNALSPHGYGGLYQFAESSWRSTRTAMNLDPNPTLRFNAEEAIKTAAFKIATNGPGAWPNCSK